MIVVLGKMLGKTICHPGHVCSYFSRIVDL